MDRQRRAKILRLAAECLEGTGDAKWTYGQIAKQSGCSVSTVARIVAHKETE